MLALETVEWGGVLGSSIANHRELDAPVAIWFLDRSRLVLRATDGAAVIGAISLTVLASWRSKIDLTAQWRAKAAQMPYFCKLA